MGPQMAETQELFFHYPHDLLRNLNLRWSAGPGVTLLTITMLCSAVGFPLAAPAAPMALALLRQRETRLQQ